MIRIVAVISLFTLVSCGADGEPITPTTNTNVTLSNNGVRAGTNLRLGGPFNVNLGVGL